MYSWILCHYHSCVFIWICLHLLAFKLKKNIFYIYVLCLRKVFGTFLSLLSNIKLQNKLDGHWSKELMHFWTDCRIMCMNISTRNLKNTMKKLFKARTQHQHHLWTDISVTGNMMMPLGFSVMFSWFFPYKLALLFWNLVKIIQS